jgi:membrane protease YdiL (CAAX protease family)
MRPLEKVYWLRLGLGIIAALICISYGIISNTITNDPARWYDYTIFFNGSSMALIVYLLSYYFIKFKLKTVVEKPQKLMTTGIGIYLLSWLVFWVLLYTIIAAMLQPV